MPNELDTRIPLMVDNSLPFKSTPFENIDPVASETKAYKLSELKGEVEEAQTDRQQKQNDRMVIDQFLKTGGDLHTPEGLETALTELKGKISPDSYMRLSKTAEDKKQSELKIRRSLSELDDQEIATGAAKQEETLKRMNTPLSAYKTTLDQTGDETKAQQAYQASKAATLQMVSQQKSASGEPMFPPEMLKKFEEMPPQQLESLVKDTAWKHKLMLDEANLKLKSAQVEGAESLAQRRRDLTEIDEQKLVVARDKVAKAAAGASMDPEALKLVAEDYRIHGSNAISRFSAAIKPAIMAEAARLNKEEGIGAREGALESGFIKADQASLNKQRQQLDAVTAFEKTADTIGDKLVEAAKKVDNTGVPAIERWVRAGRKSVQGDPDVTELNARMTTFRTEAARIISNPNLVGVLSDSARHELEGIMDSSSSAEQVERGVEVLKSEAKIRRDNIAQQIAATQERMKRGAAKENPTDHESFPKVTKEEQGSRDSDRVKILMDEKKSIEDKIDNFDNNTPADVRHRAEQDLEAVSKELKAAGAQGSKTSKKSPSVSNW